MEFTPHDKLLLHTGRLHAFVNNDLHAPPALVEISPTNDCNAKCPWCFYVHSSYKQKHSKDEIDRDVLIKTIYDLEALGVPALTWTGGGDPSVYTAIDDAIDAANDLGIKQGMFTNAYKPLRSPEKLTWIRITITEKFVITRHVAAYAEVTKVGVNFNLSHENAFMLEPMLLKAKDAGVAYFQVRPALADTWDQHSRVYAPTWLMSHETEKFRIFLTPYKFEDQGKPHGYPICHGHRFVPTIWHNGDVAVCGYHFGKEAFNFGNLNTHSFPEIWASEKRRSMIQNGVAVIPECQHQCKHHEINKTLAMIKREAGVPDDLEFI